MIASAIERDSHGYVSRVSVPPAFAANQVQVARLASPLERPSKAETGAQGACSTARVESVTISRMAATRQSGRFKAVGGSKHYDLICTTAGKMSFDQYGQSAQIGAGDLLLVSKMDSFTFWASDDAACALLSLPRDWLRGWLPDPEACVLQPVRAADPWATLLPKLVEDIDRATEVGQAFSTSLVSDQIGGVIGLIFAGSRGTGTSYRRALHRELLRTMRSRFSDPDLSPRDIAEHHRISLRYLHSIFSSVGSTFGTELRNIRLERYRQMLQSPAFSGQNVSELGHCCGYRDATHLSRIFRAAYGHNPSDYRSAVKQSNN